MKLLNLFYFLKPAIPHDVRLRLRGHSPLDSANAEQTLADQRVGSAAAEWWSGWPEGKKFAFVLTHDVEGEKGMELPGTGRTGNASGLPVVVQLCS